MRSTKKTPALGAMVLAFFSCAAGPALTAADDDRVPDDVSSQYNVRYREGTIKSCTLDLAMPKERRDKPWPAIVVIHGGGWVEGDKSSFSTPRNRPPGNIFDFARSGFVAATINYRLSKDAPFPAALVDCQCAVRFLRAHARDYQLDPEHIGAWGNSAGGHLAMLLGMIDPGVKLEEEAPWREQSAAVQSIVSDSGPIDLAYQYEHNQVRSVIGLFLGGPPERVRLADYKLASPASHISARTPPLMLIYGGADTQVGVETADRFVVQLEAAGLKDISYLRLGNVDHCPHSLIRVPWLQPAVIEFFTRTLINHK